MTDGLKWWHINSDEGGGLAIAADSCRIIHGNLILKIKGEMIAAFAEGCWTEVYQVPAEDSIDTDCPRESFPSIPVAGHA